MQEDDGGTEEFGGNIEPFSEQMQAGGNKMANQTAVGLNLSI